ncbi:MAG: AMP-binding protein [Gammaproteobacteria bacterium]|nr:AMP-binding protein [Gammaproteobacteria bacterium]
MSDALGDILFDASASHASSVCLRLLSGEIWRYSDVQDQALRMAAELHARGVSQGERVLVQVEKSPHAVCLYLACVYAGIVYVPLNTAYTVAEIDYFVKDAKLRLLIRDEASLAQTDVPALTLNALVESSCNRAPLARPVAAGRDTPAAILYTSGTTGRPKGAQLSHGNLVSNAQALRQVWEWRDEDVLLHALPIYHVHGLFVALHAALFGGSEIRFLPRFNVEDVLAMLPGCSVLMGVPTHYARLLDSPAFDAELTKSVRLMISGSAPMTSALHQRLRARAGKFVVERYGLTEGMILTSCAIDAADKPGSVGYALPGVDLRVARRGIGEDIGEIEAKGPGIFLGYFGNRQATIDVMTSDGYIRTGDLGRLDADGALTITGRAKDLIISGGLNVYPREVEAEIDRLPGVAESAVIGAPHADFGEGVVAVIVGDSPGFPDALPLEVVRSELTGRLARFKLPKAVVHVDELPRNQMGKVLKNILRDLHKGIFSGNE